MCFEDLMKDEAAARTDAFLEKLLLPADPVATANDARSRAAGLMPIAISPLQGAFLTILAAAIGATRILEIGTLGGFSAIALARGLASGGKVLSLERDGKAVETARLNVAAAGLVDLVEIIEGPATGSLRAMIARGEAPFDLIFIDADKESYPRYLELVLELSRVRTLIIADNVVREGEVANPASEDPRVRGVRSYLEKAKAHPRLTTTVLQTLGAKGHDGFAFSLVR
jgi:predicted O-methyltransferase YrrM